MPDITTLFEGTDGATRENFNRKLSDVNAHGNDTTVHITAAEREKWNQVSNPNLLHNWDFRAPVNQNNVTSWTTGYGIDRWLNAVGSNINVDSGCLTLNATSVLTQIVPPEMVQRVVGKLVTISCVDTDGVVYSGSGIYPASGTTTIVFDNTALRSYIPSSNNAAVQFLAKQTKNIVTVKLELGSVSTLANDPPADYGEQLALCQRYQFNNVSWFRVRATQLNADNIDFFVPLPVSMRISPTVRGNWMIKTLPGGLQSGFTLSAAWKTDNGVQLRFTKAAHGLTDAYAEFPTGTTPLFDANL